MRITPILYRNACLNNMQKTRLNNKNNTSSPSFTSSCDGNAETEVTQYDLNKHGVKLTLDELSEIGICKKCKNPGSRYPKYVMDSSALLIMLF